MQVEQSKKIMNIIVCMKENLSEFSKKNICASWKSIFLQLV